MRPYNRRWGVDPNYVIAGQEMIIATPTSRVDGRYGTLLMPGAATLAQAFWRGTDAAPAFDGAQASMEFSNKLVSGAGTVFVSHDLTYNDGTATPNVNPWGNKQSRDAIDYIRTSVMASLGCRTDKIGLIAAAGGATGKAIMYAQERPDKVAFLILLASSLDIEKNRFGAAPGGDVINKAWGRPNGQLPQVNATTLEYYGTSLTYETGSPLAGQPCCSLDPRMMTRIRDLLVPYVPVRYIYSTADTQVMGASSNGVPNAGPEYWCPFVGVTAEICSTTADHQDVTQTTSWPVVSIAKTIALAS